MDKRFAVVAVAVALLTGCGSAVASMPSASNPSSASDLSGTGRASAVVNEMALMMSRGALTEASLVSYVITSGGGYVTDIRTSGKAGTLGYRITMDTVLGTSVVRPPDAPPIDEVYPRGTPVALACYRFIAGWYDTIVSGPYRIQCRQMQAASLAQASRVADAWLIAQVLIPPPAVPDTRRAAIRLIEQKWKISDQQTIQATRLLTRLSFASGSGLAAGAVPMSDGGCIYVSFGAGDTALARPLFSDAWPAPADARCTAAAALAASGPLSYNPADGG